MRVVSWSLFSWILILLMHIGESYAKTAPFPRWLRDITGMTCWPDDDPPYIPLDFIDLDDVPYIEPREEGECSDVDPEDCSFDCHACIAPEDVYTCSTMSQTFDDGPTPATLRLLRHLRHKTTFFTLGENIIQYPHIFRRQHEEGHLLGSHTWSHKRLTAISNEEVAAQIQWSIWAMNATAGIVPRFFRPPYGAVDNRIRDIAAQFGLITVLWDRDPEDWRMIDDTLSYYDVTSTVRQWQRYSSRGLILEHDNSWETVDAAVYINRRLGHQKTVAGCIGTRQWYQNRYR